MGVRMGVVGITRDERKEAYDEPVIESLAGTRAVLVKLLNAVDEVGKGVIDVNGNDLPVSGVVLNTS
jgi:hypothetical protein